MDNDSHHRRLLERLASLIEDGMSGRLSRRELIRRGLALGLSLPAVAAALAACGMEPPRGAGQVSPWRPTDAPAAAAGPPASTPAPLRASALPAAPAPTAAPPAPLRFAVIGDYGMAGEPEGAVAALVAGWTPDFIVTTGDNNYPDGSADTIDANVGQYYGAFIGPYAGAYGQGAAENRFFPSLGNHDWVAGYPEPYLRYFAGLPGNGRYYRVDRGPLSLFVLDSMPGEPDGISPDSVQGQWLQGELAASRARWKAVAFHHAPFSSGHHGPAGWMQWPFAEWGAQLVLAGHDHTYERIARDGITYVVNGLGGGARYAPGGSPAEGSQVFFNADHGAMLVEADEAGLRLRFVTRSGAVVDDATLP